MIEFVFLDLDDTILDFHMAEAVALRKTMSHFGVDPTDEAVARYSAINRAQWERLERGELNREQVKLRRFELFFAELGVNICPQDARTYYEERLAVGHYFLKGGKELLDDLKQTGKYRLFIASNGTTPVQVGRIASAGIEPYFEKIFLSEALGYNKPQKEFFDACFGQIPDFDLAKAIILGDSLTSDILGGINAGIKTCWYNLRGGQGRADIVPDFAITDLREFLPLLERL